MAFEHGLDARIAQVGIRDDRVREAGPVSRFLEPLRLLDRVGRADGRLDVDSFRHVRVSGDGDEVFSQPVSLGQLPGLRPEDRVIDVRLPVSIEELRVTHVVEMDVCVDEFGLFHV